MIGLAGKSIGLSAAIVGLLCLGLAPDVRAAESESLASLVPATAGMCVEVRDLAGMLASFQNGSLARSAAQNPLIRAKLGPDVKRLAGLPHALIAQLGISADQVAVLLSDRLLLAVWPEEPPGKNGPGLLIVRCPDESLLENVGLAVVDRQRKAGRLAPSRTLAAHGRSAVVHSINTDSAGSQVCLAIVGNLAIVCTSGSMLDEIVAARLGRLAAPGGSSSAAAAWLANLPAYRAAIERLNPAAPVRAFLNPRPWDQQMHSKARPASGRQSLIHDAIRGLWDASDYASASLAAADSLELEVFLGCQQNRLSPTLRSTLASFEGKSQLVDRLPAQCLAVATGRIDVGRMSDALLDAAASGEYSIRLPGSIGWAAAAAVAGSLGPECGLAILPPANSSTTSEPPVDWVLGIQSRGLEHDPSEPPTASWLLPWLRETLRVSAATAKTHDKQAPFQCAVSERDGVQLTSISGGIHLPACQTLFLAQDNRLLWLGNSAPLTAQAVIGRPPASPPNQRYRSLHNPRLDAPSDLLLLDLAAIGRLAAARATPLAPGKLAELVSLAEVADALLIEIQCQPTRIAVSLKIASD